MSPRSTCPEAPVLEQLALGRLAGPDADAVERHVALCPRCLATLQALPAEDALVRALRPPLRDEELTRRELAESIIPALKRLRPRDATLTGGPAAGATAAEGGAAGDTPSDGFPFLSPPRGPGEIGRLGPFRVLGLLGGGGMGVVFRAEDPALRRPLALKVIRPRLVASAEARARFLREAQALAALEHDHIVAVYQVGEANGVPFLAMPLLRGQTLQQRLDQAGGPLPIDDVLRLGREIAAGLAVAHARGFIHRDVKPGNVWIESDPGPPPAAGRERVKILDFGLVQALAAGEGEAGRTDVLLGTPAYMAPEQASGKPVDGRADLFSLGCVLYRMATGRPAFDGDNLCRLLAHVAVDEPAPPRQLNSAVPAALEGLIVRLLRKKPEDRPESAQAVAEELQAIEAARRPRLWRRWLIGAALAVLAAAALAAWGVRRWTPAPPAPGAVTFDYDEPDGRIAVQQGDEVRCVVDPRRDRTVSLPPGEYTLRPAVPTGQRWLWPAVVLVKPGESQTVAVRLIGAVAGHRTHSGAVRGLAACPRKDGLLVLSVGDRTLVAWDPAGPGKPETHWHRDSPLRCLAVAAGGRVLATGSGDVGPQAQQVIRFWDPDSLEPRPGGLPCRSQVNALAFSPDGARLLVGENDGTVSLWDPDAGVAEAELAGAHGGLGVFAVGFLPDGKHVLTGGGDGAVVERTTAGLGPVRTLTGNAGPVRGLAVLPDGRRAVSAGSDGTVRVWDLAGGPARTWAVAGRVEAVAVSPDGTRLLTGDAAGAVRLWDRAAEREIVHFDGHARGVTAVAFTPDGRRALSGGADGAVRLWELPK